jgi:kynurenine formamidase
MIRRSFLSHPLNSKTPSYGNRDRFEIQSTSRIADGNTANNSSLFFSANHIGTHVDVPKHFYDDGATLTDVAPDLWVFDHVHLVDVPCSVGRLLGSSDLTIDAIPENTEMLLIRTGFEASRNEERYWNAYPGLDPAWCTEIRKMTTIRAIGFDFISLTSPLFKPEGKLAHLVLLEERQGRFVMIIEDMRLAHLKSDPTKVTMLPLYVENGNGGPVTVLAEE